MPATATSVKRTYYLLLLGNTLAASLIWGINTIFLLDAGLSNLEAFAANAFAVGQARGRLVVRKELMVRLNAPRFFRTGDVTTLRASVHDETDAPMSVSWRAKAEGLEIARRTVAKYRESISIPPSNQRKSLV